MRSLQTVRLAPSNGELMSRELKARQTFSVVRVDPADGLPASVRQAGGRAEEKYVEFFTARIRNPNTRAAYLHAVKRFFAWTESASLPLTHIRPFHVAAYVEQLASEQAAPTVKQHLAAIRQLFDYLVVGQVTETNAASAVRGPSYFVKVGKTPVLEEGEARHLIDSIDTASVVGLRDRAIIGLMVYTFARIGAVVAMSVDDYFPQGKRWWVRLHEKGGKLHDVPAHHRLEEYLDAYIEAAGILDERRAPLFRTTRGTTRLLTTNRLSRQDAYRMIQRRSNDADLQTAVGCHSFRATGITNYLLNGGTLEKAQKIANHESARTTKLYDRRDDRLTLDEVERITI